MNQEELYLFDLNGYLVIEDVLTQEEVATANQAIDQNLDKIHIRPRDQRLDGVGQNLSHYHPLTIGTANENPMRLCSCDWAWVYADNQSNIRGCVMDSGTWHVEVAKEGLYSLTLRRWPQESELGISTPAPVMQGVDGLWPEGKALPVASAWLQAGNVEQHQPVVSDATQVMFETELKTGATTFKSWWYNSEGEALAGAYYLTVERLSS